MSPSKGILLGSRTPPPPVIPSPAEPARVPRLHLLLRLCCAHCRNGCVSARRDLLPSLRRQLCINGVRRYVLLHRVLHVHAYPRISVVPAEIHLVIVVHRYLCEKTGSRDRSPRKTNRHCLISTNLLPLIIGNSVRNAIGIMRPWAVRLAIDRFRCRQRYFALSSAILRDGAIRSVGVFPAKWTRGPV